MPPCITRAARSTFFVNLSRATLKDPDLLPSVIRWLRESNAKPDYLVFEADEPDLLAEPTAATFIKATRKIGCHFAIDNFGKNLGATEHLRELPITYLKIDGSLIRNINTDTVNQTTLARGAAGRAGAGDEDHCQIRREGRKSRGIVELRH